MQSSCSLTRAVSVAVIYDSIEREPPVELHLLALTAKDLDVLDLELIRPVVVR